MRVAKKYEGVMGTPIVMSIHIELMTLKLRVFKLIEQLGTYVSNEEHLPLETKYTGGTE